MAAPARAAKQRTYVSTYEGTYSYESNSVSDRGNFGGKQTLTWKETVYTEWPSGVMRRTLSAQGSQNYAGSGGSESIQIHCTYSAGGDTSKVPIEVQPDDDEAHLRVIASIPTAYEGGPVTGSGTNSTGAGCVPFNFNYASPDGAEQTGSCASFPATPEFMAQQTVHNLSVNGGTVTIDKDQTATPGSGCTGGQTFTASRSIHAKVTVGGGGRPSHPAYPPNTPAAQKRQKLLAAKDLLETVERAEGPCGQLALAGVAALWGATVPGVGAAAALTAAMMAPVAGALCVTYAKWMFDDVNIIDDPPKGNLRKIAKPKRSVTSAAAAKKLPTCTDAATKDYCTALRAAAADQIAAAGRAQALAAALLITVDRETKARKTGAGRALKRQLNAGDDLAAKFKQAAAAERKAGGKVADLITAAGVTGQLTAEQDAKAIAEVDKRAKAKGLRKLAPRTAGAYDLVAGMR